MHGEEAGGLQIQGHCVLDSNFQVSSKYMVRLYTPPPKNLAKSEGKQGDNVATLLKMLYQKDVVLGK